MLSIKTLILVSDERESAFLAQIVSEYPQLVVLPRERHLEIAEVILQTSPDLIFLDIEMVDRLSDSFLETMSETRSVFFIFISAHHQHALKAFELGALDYLLRPLQDDRVCISIQRALRQMENLNWQKIAQRLRAVLNQSGISDNPAEFPRRMTVKVGGRIEFVQVDAIHWVEAADQYVNLHAGTKVYLIRMRMSDFEQRLNREDFFRIHRRAIVNLQFINEIIQRNGKCFAVLKNGVRIQVSRSRKDEFLKALGNISYLERAFDSTG